MSNISIWLKAFRLRTLPLSVSGVLVGSFLAMQQGFFNIHIFILALLTTLFLQILSNLANDYGDSKNGADNTNRVGPKRTVQSGLISMPAMRRTIGVFITLSFITGVTLLYNSNIKLFSGSFLILLILGITAIWAAINYTMGKNPYGYSGWGDLSVFLFFGLFSVVATYYLYVGKVSLLLFLPATTVGLLSVGVLNLNNMRDIENDTAVGKKTLVVAMGFSNAKKYHAILIVIALLCIITYIFIAPISKYAFLSSLVFIPLFLHLKRVLFYNNHLLIDPELKKMALLTLFFSLIFGLLINI